MNITATDTKVTALFHAGADRYEERVYTIGSGVNFEGVTKYEVMIDRDGELVTACIGGTYRTLAEAVAAVERRDAKVRQQRDAGTGAPILVSGQRDRQVAVYSDGRTETVVR